MIFKYEEVRDERKNQIASNTNIRLNNVNPSGENVVPDNLKNHANFIICGGRGPSARGRPLDAGPERLCPTAISTLNQARGTSSQRGCLSQHF